MLKIKSIRENKKLTQDDVVAKTGIPKRSYVDYENEKQDISLERLRKIATALGVSVSELIGDDQIIVGKMFDVVSEPVVNYRKSKDGLREEQMIPLYSLEASAGIVKLFNDSKKFEPVDFLRIPNLPKSDGAVYVTGDSMYPLLKSGDIVIYKKHHNTIDSIFFGEMYIVSVDLDGDELTTVKWIQKSDIGEDYVKLVSQNQHHQPKDVHISRILALALVKASVRINSMS